MKKNLYYIICIVTSLFLSGCQQDSCLPDKDGEVVTLNYILSPDDVHSRNGVVGELVVNKLRCEIYEVDVVDNDTLYKRIRTDIRDKNTDVSQSYFTYSVSLFKDVEYRIVFWAYYQSPDHKVYYELDSDEGLRGVTVNAAFREESAGIYEDAFTAVAAKKKGQLIKSLVNVELSRPMGLVDVNTTKERWEQSVEKGRVPSTSILVLTGFSDKYDALTKKWSHSGSDKVEYYSVVSASNYSLVNELVFANGNSRCDIYVYDNSLPPLQIYTCTLWSFPIDTNKRTHVRPEE